MSNKSFGKGLFFACLAFFLWGIFPLYWRLLLAVDSLHVLSFRVILSLMLVGVILLVRRNYAWLAVFRTPRLAGHLIPAGLLITCNWGLYIWAVQAERTVEASLGYYINPLVSVLLGLIFFRERLRPLQWVSVAVAFAGILFLTIMSGALPWISLVLAGTFGFYGLLKKRVQLSALESLGAETLAALPIGVLLLFFSFQAAAAGSLYPAFSGLQGLNYLANLPPLTLLLLSLSGLITMLPLYCFAKGVRQLPLSTIGFTQFIGPTLQFLIGVFVFREPFPLYYFIAFVFIWTAVALYVIDLLGNFSLRVNSA